MGAPGTTPGPWRIHWIRASVPMEPYRVIATNGDRVTRWGTFIKPSQPAASANAHLIAAAPDLYEALAEACDEIRELRHYANNHGGMIDELDFVAGLATLAKARGEAQS